MVSSTLPTKKVLSPAKSGELITHNANDVAVIQAGIEKTAVEILDALKSERLSLKNFKQSELHPQVPNEKAIDWIFLVDTLNFCFWTGAPSNENGEGSPKWQVAYKGQVYTGYFALCAAVNRAMTEDGLDITNPKVFGSLTLDDIHRIFRSETTTTIPLPEERIKNLKEASEVLLSKYSGSFVNCVTESKGSAVALLELVVQNFASYRDQNDYDDSTKVSFLKRAQILVADIWACFEGKGLGTFGDIEALTMFADYRVPQVLLHFGAMRYSPKLQSILENDEELQNGNRLEMEIRGASIHAVEKISEKVKTLLREADLPESSINSIMIDHFLWDYRREHAEALEKFPYHKTRCIFY